MVLEEKSVNPYAVPASIESHDLAIPIAEAPLTKPLWKVFACWTFVCVFSAAPSFFFGLGLVGFEKMFAMLLGIAFFVALYTWLDRATQTRNWRQAGPVRLTLRIGYITRIVISILYPVAGFLDLLCGLASISVVGWFYTSLIDGGASIEPNTDSTFGWVLMVTLTQGVLLNIVLAVYMGIVLGIVSFFRLVSGSRNVAKPQ